MPLRGGDECTNKHTNVQMYRNSPNSAGLCPLSGPMPKNRYDDNDDDDDDNDEKNSGCSGWRLFLTWRSQG